MHRPLFCQSTAAEEPRGPSLPSHPLVTEQTHVAFENAELRLEWNVVRNRATTGESRALKIRPADQSRHAAVIVPQLIDGRLLLLGRYRYAIARWSLEFPRYWGESSDEGWLEQAADSLLRSTGLRSARMRLLGALHADPELVAYTTLVILAENCGGPPGPPPDPQQLIAGTQAVNRQELQGLARRGDICCGVTLAALALLRAQVNE